MERNAPTPDTFEAVVTAFADALIRSYRDRWNRGGDERRTSTAGMAHVGGGTESSQREDAEVLGGETEVEAGPSEVLEDRQL